MMSGITAQIEKTAELWPDRIAISTREGRLTYHELQLVTTRFANSCLSNGILPGDRVVISASSRLETAISIFGTLKFGGIIVCLHPRTPEARLADIIHNSGASLVITNGKSNLNVVDQTVKLKITLSGEGEMGWVKFDDFLDSGFKHTVTQKVNKIAALIYTSGSTGVPRGVISTHENIIFTTNSINMILGNNEKDVIVNYLPLSFDYGLYQLFLGCFVGAEVYLGDSTYFAIEITNAFVEHKATAFPGMRSMFALMEHLKGDVRFPSIRYVTNTGDALLPRHRDFILDKFPNVRLYAMYGLTECKRVSYLPPEKLMEKQNCVGIPIPGTKVRVCDLNGESVSPFTTGELWVEGPHVCDGYWNNEEESDRVFVKSLERPVQLRTGDLFYQDDEGYLFFVERMDDQFKKNGFRINPIEIENMIGKRFTQIYELAVCGVNWRGLEKTICLYAVIKDIEEADMLRHEIKAFCNKTLESWKCPKHIILGTEIPLTDSGKLDRKKITRLILHALNNEQELNVDKHEHNV